MPDIWMDVDATLAEVPVTIMPLIDDTDFKTREDGIVYNQAGMDLLWNFVTTAGAETQTAVTPTTGGGDYDWTNQGNGIYSIGIPASGGISINNDTEGFGWFTGYCTGVLPWRGPTIGFRAAGLNNVLVDTAYSATRGLAGTALPDAAADAAGGLPISDAGGLDLDSQIGTDINAILVDTNELQTDWTNGGRLDLIVDELTAQGDTNEGKIDTVIADTNELQTDWTNGGRLDLIIDELTTQGDTNEGKIDVVDGIVDAIVVDTAEIGVAGAGLTNIDLPNQTMDITGNITGNLSGSVGSVTGAVGSVTGAVGSVTGNVGGNVVGSVASVTANVTVGDIVAAALAKFFATDSGTTYAAAIGGSVVKEIADNAGGAALTEAGIADAVWEEAIADHSGTVGSTAEQLAAAGAAGDPWATAIPGAYGGGTAGKVVGDSLTGHTPQTGDSYAEVTDVTYGLSAIETLISALNDLSTTDIENITIDVLTLKETLRRCLSLLSGNFTGALSRTVVFKRQDGLTTEATATVTADARTVA